MAGYAVDAVGFADDWGTQQGLMISPAQWRESSRPRYAEQFERIHRQGKKVWFHSCGNLWDILGDFIDIGVDVLELLQPDIFGIDGWRENSAATSVSAARSITSAAPSPALARKFSPTLTS